MLETGDRHTKPSSHTVSCLDFKPLVSLKPPCSLALTGRPDLIEACSPGPLAHPHNAQ